MWVAHPPLDAWVAVHDVRRHAVRLQRVPHELGTLWAVDLHLAVQDVSPASLQTDLDPRYTPASKKTKHLLGPHIVRHSANSTDLLIELYTNRLIAGLSFFQLATCLLSQPHTVAECRMMQK